jgi:hypothetical protein
MPQWWLADAMSQKTFIEANGEQLVKAELKVRWSAHDER